MASKIVADQRARGGTRGAPVLVVLVGALVLCAVALAGFLFWTGGQTPTSPQQAESQRSTTAPSSSNANSVPAGNPAYPARSASPGGTQGSAPARP